MYPSHRSRLHENFGISHSEKDDIETKFDKTLGTILVSWIRIEKRFLEAASLLEMSKRHSRISWKSKSPSETF
jgi:hypothetical protein